MIYALNDHAISYGDDTVGEYADESAAQDALRYYIEDARGRGQLKYDNLVQLYLFRSREEAQSANQTDEDEVLIDEAKAFRTLEWERGFGFNF